MRTPLLLTSAVVLVLVSLGGAAQTDQRIAMPLSDPARPATLDVSLFIGSISVSAYEGNEIIVVVREGRDEDEDDDDDDDDPDPARDGLRRIPNTGLGVTVQERDNTVSIQMDWRQRGADLEITVPRRTSVRAKTVNGGDVTIAGVTGEHEISNVNGGIVARDIAGSIVANTTNGDVEASFAEVTAGKPMSFSSFNGDIEVAFPASLKAALRITGGRGDVWTDFDIVVQPQEAVVERGGGDGRNQVRMERETRVTIGGGGPEIQFKTFNGDITIRKR
jgi:Putative adhesin